MRICRRACWPPESDSNRCCAAPASPYRSSAELAASRAMPSRFASPRCRMSSSVRPRNSGCSWFCANHPGTTRAPSTARPSCGTRASVSPTVVTCPSVRSGSVPPPASRRRKCDLPEPFDPSTATRSPYQTSRSNGFMSPVSSRPSHTTERLPVRAPRSRIETACAGGRSSGGPASSNLRSRVTAAWYRDAMPSLYVAFTLRVATSCLSAACCSSQRRRSSSSRSNRSSRARGTPRSCRRAPTPCCRRRRPRASRCGRRLARASSRSCETSSTVFGVARSCASSQRLPGTSSELSGSSSSSTCSGPRNSASSASRFCSPPESVASSRHFARSNGMPSAAIVQWSQTTSWS